MLGCGRTSPRTPGWTAPSPRPPRSTASSRRPGAGGAWRYSGRVAVEPDVGTFDVEAPSERLVGLAHHQHVFALRVGPFEDTERGGRISGGDQPAGPVGSFVTVPRVADLHRLGGERGGIGEDSDAVVGSLVAPAGRHDRLDRPRRARAGGDLGRSDRRTQ